MATIFDVMTFNTAADIHLWSLPNIRGEGPERWIGSRSEARIASFVAKRDRPGFGTFFCVSTIAPGQKRRKGFARELPFLFSDVDFKDIDLAPDEIERILRALPCPPSRMHYSGYGIHCFWTLERPLGADDMDEAEVLLRRIANHVGGDKSVCHRVALLRVPRTHNSKRGEWREVRTIHEGRERYTLDDIEAWLRTASSPAIVRRNAECAPTNPFTRLAEEQGYAPPVDVFARLEAMKFKGEGDAGIHQTQLSVTASMAYHDVDEDDAVAEVYEATMALPEAAGWNAAIEERKIRRMYRDAVAKFKR